MAIAEYRVAALFRYPLKSAAGLRREHLELDRFGVRHDRRWMVVDPAGAPITQRELPALVRLRARRTAGGLALEWPEVATGGDASRTRALQVEEPPVHRFRVPIRIWGDTVHLPLAGEGASAWLSEALGRDAALAFMPDDVERPVDPRYASADDRTSLTDGYPLHLVGSGSLSDLNRRLDRPVGIERFRPNLYIEGPPPYDEDAWEEIRVGEVRLRVVKPCSRCAVTTVDPTTGERGKEPLRTLARFRKREAGVVFGQNALHEGFGTLRAGDPVEVLSRRDVPTA